MSSKEFMLSNCVVRGDCWESLGQQGDQTSQSSHPSTNQARTCLASEIRWDRVRSGWYGRRLNQSILKDINPENSLEGIIPKLKYFGQLMRRPAHWQRPWCWERLKAGGKGDDRGWDSWMALPTQWTWVWASSGRQWKTEKPDMLHSVGLQRVGHVWVTELNWTKNSRGYFLSGTNRSGCLSYAFRIS